MRLALLMLTPLVAGCVTASPEAICDGTREARADHAKALAASPDDAAVMTGAALIAKIDGACGG